MSLKLLLARVVRMAPDRLVTAVDTLRGFPRLSHPIAFSSATDPEPPFFIVGCGRSGNTLLRNLLCRDYDTCIPPEIPGLGNTIRRFTQCRGQPWSVVVDRVLQEFARNADADRTFAVSGVVYNLGQQLGIDYPRLRQQLLELPTEQRSLARILVGIYRDHALRNAAGGETRIGDKTPWNAFHVGRIARTFPTARFIHMVRDPRATVASYMANFNGIQAVTCEAGTARWIDSNRKLMAFSRSHPDRVRVLRYEDLVADPEASVRGVADFLGLRARADAVQVEHGDRMLPHYAKSFGAVEADSLDKWRSILDAAQVRDIERACAPLMRAFGYAGAGSAPTRSGPAPNCTLFLHIEKAAGSTMHDIMYANFMPYYVASPATYRPGSSTHETFLSPPQLARLLRGGVKAAGGHSIRCTGDYAAVGLRPLCFAFLRDPVDRYLSHHAYQQEVMGIERPFEEFLADPYFANFMCKKIAGEGTAAAAIDVIERQGIFLGLVEQFDKSLLILKSLLEAHGIVRHFDPRFEIRNSSADRAAGQAPATSAELLARHGEAIAANNREDLQLYQYAVQRLAGMATPAHEPSRQGLRLPRPWRIRIGKAIRKLYFRPLEKRVGYNADAWVAPEKTPDVGDNTPRQP